MNLTRRAAIGASLATCIGPNARAEQHVFINYTQSELDRAYDQSAWAPNAAALIAQYGIDSAATRKTYVPRNEPYGATPGETLDVFAPTTPGRAPILVFLHGGAWLRLTRSDASTPAPTIVDAGGVYVAPDFAPASSGGMAAMVDQCRHALVWIARNAASFHGDPARIVLAGHSSGAHLAACLLTTDWTQFGQPTNLVKGAVLLSGIYDLYPAALSSRAAAMKVTPEQIAALSPIRHLDRIVCPVIVGWGDQDSPEFKRQSMVFAEALQGMGALRARHPLFNTNHFQVPRQLDRPDTVIGHATLQLMGLA